MGSAPGKMKQMWFLKVGLVHAILSDSLLCVCACALKSALGDKFSERALGCIPDWESLELSAEDDLVRPVSVPGAWQL
jgi:hypothetical protein